MIPYTFNNLDESQNNVPQYSLYAVKSSFRGSQKRQNYWDKKGHEGTFGGDGNVLF